ncbi:hypothetical protein OH491_11145 [Termitidicoccus mucosus]|uniref:8-oxoguanine DNA glycosylase OGG fold protein n=1 Tax=Termitidicoccus mucosus TaxID=1184151 RepID=UPI0011AB7E31
MPPPYRNPHWNTFAGIPYALAGPVGFAPAQWVATHKLANVPAGAIPLPTTQICRTTVRAICRNPANPVLFGYVCAMAWGAQGAGLGGAGHVVKAWANHAQIIPKLTALRRGNMTRCQAYNLFCGCGRVCGLGPAYFTKLLYFFSPTPDFYIMDQWTAKSVDLLTGNWVVRMAGNAVANYNKCGNYKAYCEEIDHIAGQLGGGITGEQVEEMLMSKGGYNPWQWRSHVRNNWPIHKPVGRYKKRSVHASYPYIPMICF